VLGLGVAANTKKNTSLALAAAADMIAPVLADAAVTSTRRLLQRRYQGRLAASLLRRQLLVSAARELSPSDRTP
jgi:hypothetical protein